MHQNTNEDLGNVCGFFFLLFLFFKLWIFQNYGLITIMSLSVLAKMYMGLKRTEL